MFTNALQTFLSAPGVGLSRSTKALPVLRLTSPPALPPPPTSVNTHTADPGAGQVRSSWPLALRRGPSDLWRHGSRFLKYSLEIWDCRCVLEMQVWVKGKNLESVRPYSCSLRLLSAVDRYNNDSIRYNVGQISKLQQSLTDGAQEDETSLPLSVTVGCRFVFGLCCTEYCETTGLRVDSRRIIPLRDEVCVLCVCASDGNVMWVSDEVCFCYWYDFMLKMWLMFWRCGLCER